MRDQRFLFRALTSATVLALALVGCGSGSDNGSKAAPMASSPTGSITYWHFFTDREEKAIQAVVTDFEAANPGVKVTVKGGQDDEKMRQAIAAGKGPDVGLSYSTDIVGNFCSTGAWQDLEPLIKRDKVAMDSLLPIVRSYTEYNGKRCSMPMLADTYGLYYNKKMLAAAGYTSPPKTLSEFDAMVVKLTKKNKDGSINIAGFVPLLDFYENSAAHLAPSWNATWLTKDGKSNIGSDPAWKAMLEWQKSLADKIGAKELQKFNAKKGEEFSADNAFQKEKVAMMVDGEYRIAFIKDQAPGVDFGTAPFPVPDDQAARYGAGYVTGNIMGISKGSKNPETAWALIKYLTLDTGAIVKLANGIKNVPTTHEALASPKLEVDANFKTFIDIFQNAGSQTSPSTGNGAVYQNQFGDFVDKWQRGQVTNLDAGLKKLDDQINKALALGQAP
ncbi:MAG: multiple sugar transport system substrate-binding protein [Actinomycetota bacterium]|nr:multiple sugar transport system substrate-binding protein [Actinomycetota bacterium]